MKLEDLIGKTIASVYHFRHEPSRYLEPDPDLRETPANAIEIVFTDQTAVRLCPTFPDSNVDVIAGRFGDPYVSD